MRKCARDAFGFRGHPYTAGQFCPYLFALHLAGMNGRGAAADLVSVQVHNGLPLAARDPEKRGAMDLMSQEWAQRSDGLVETRLRPLQYPKKSKRTQCPTCSTHCSRCTRPRQKGVDLALGIAAYESVVCGDCDVAIVASHDSDLVPSIEAIIRFAGTEAVETVSWKPSHGQYRHQMPPPQGQDKVVHHYLDEGVQQQIADDTDFPALWRVKRSGRSRK